MTQPSYLSARLSAVASLIPDGSSIADIGTDHAYLPISLISSGKCRRAIAADIAPAPLAIAKDNIESAKLSHKINCVLSDGMQALSANDADTFIIAGMGGETIADILDKCKFSKNPEFTYVLQPMSRKEALRKYLFDNGFSILTELLAREGDKIYTVFSAKYIGEATVYTHFDLIFGKMPPTDSPHFYLYLEKEYSRLKRQYDGQIASASSNEQSVSQLSNVISQIERILSNGV